MWPTLRGCPSPPVPPPAPMSPPPVPWPSPPPMVQIAGFPPAPPPPSTPHPIRVGSVSPELRDAAARAAAFSTFPPPQRARSTDDE
eukprot:gene27692-32303_t